MKKLLNKKNIVIGIAVVLLLCIVIYIAYTYNRNQLNEDNKTNNSITTEDLETVEKMYNIISNFGCNSTILDNVMLVDEYLTADMTDNDIQNIIFSGLYSNGYLEKEKIEKTKYNEMAMEIFGKQFSYPESISTYLYNGNIYELDNGYITKKVDNCLDKEYKTYLYSYTNYEQILEISMRVGYVMDNKLYDLNNNYISKYDSNNIIADLIKSTIITYKYEKEVNKYKLLSVKKIVMESE